MSASGSGGLRDHEGKHQRLEQKGAFVYSGMGSQFTLSWRRCSVSNSTGLTTGSEPRVQLYPNPDAIFQKDTGAPTGVGEEHANATLKRSRWLSTLGVRETREMVRTFILRLLLDISKKDIETEIAQLRKPGQRPREAGGHTRPPLHTSNVHQATLD